MRIAAELSMMTAEPQAIEVEVVEIDGAAPLAMTGRREEFPRPPQEPPPVWQHWQGRIRTLDARWWPLWVALGLVAVVLLLTVGLVIGVVYVIFRIIGSILRAIFG